MLLNTLIAPSYNTYTISTPNNPTFSPYRIEKIDISKKGNVMWKRKYHLSLPVVHYNGEWLSRNGLNEKKLVKKLKEDGCKKGTGRPLVDL